MHKKAIALLLVFTLSCLHLSTVSLAAENFSWANDAVTTLNTIYGDSTFTANGETVTVNAVKTLLKDNKFGYKDGDPIMSHLNSGTNLTRLQMAQVACSLYGLPENLSAGGFSDCSDNAVKTLRGHGIISGYSDGSFKPSDEVTNAEFAAILYRVLCKVGAGKDVISEKLKPGAAGYEEFMYLAARDCVKFDTDPAAAWGESLNLDVALPWAQQSFSYTELITPGTIMEIVETNEAIEFEQTNNEETADMADDIVEAEQVIDENTLLDAIIESEQSGEEVPLGVTTEFEQMGEDSQTDTITEVQQNEEYTAADAIMDSEQAEPEITAGTNIEFQQSTEEIKPNVLMEIMPTEAATHTSVTGTTNIWNAWAARLNSLPPGESRSTSFNIGSYSTLLDAAIAIVEMDRAAIGNADKRGIFSDVNAKNWWYEGVMYMFNNRIVSGYADGTFRPDTNINRVMMAAIICGTKKIDTSSPVSSVTPSDSNDIDPWGYNPVTHVIDKGYMSYTSGTTFSPHTNLTRQDAAQIVAKMFDGYSASAVNPSVLDRFSDKASIGSDYRAAMAYLVSIGVLNGTAEGNLKPTETVTRAEVGVMIARVMMGIDKSKMKDYQDAVETVKGE